MLDSIKDATTNYTFGLKGAVYILGNKVQELVVSIMPTKAIFDTFSTMLFHEVLKII